MQFCINRSFIFVISDHSNARLCGALYPTFRVEGVSVANNMSLGFRNHHEVDDVWLKEARSRMKLMTLYGRCKKDHLCRIMKDYPPGSLRLRYHIRWPDSMEDEDVQEGAVSVTMIHPGFTDRSDQFPGCSRSILAIDLVRSKGMSSRLHFIPAPVPGIVDAPSITTNTLSFPSSLLLVVSYNTVLLRSPVR